MSALEKSSLPPSLPRLLDSELSHVDRQAPFDPDRARALLEETWDRSVLPVLTDYVAIPARSPHFDPDWERAGHLERAVALAADWARAQPIPDLRIEVLRLPGRTPLLWLETAGAGRAREDSVLLYGHLDKQPEMEPWAPGLAPWKPVRRGDRLYGRGAADDGYAVFAAVSALASLRAQGTPHARCVALIETCEESGSPDLPAYLERVRARIGRASLVVGLDSGCGDYERLWCTTSLRGIAAGVLRVRVLREGVHSGDAGGIVPSSFRIARSLLARLEDADSGTIRAPAFHAEIPAERRAQAEAAAAVLGTVHWQRFPFAEGTRPMGGEDAERVLNRTWRPFLEVTGAGGLPALGDAGNVLRPETALKLSLRLPPTVDARRAVAEMRALLEADPPAGAEVRFEPDAAAQGWHAPPLAPWLHRSLENASRQWFGAPAAFMGEGGTIPFMAMLGAAFPEAQFLITGVLGPGANAHGPNEFLHLPTARRLAGCVAQVIADHGHTAV
jgi:acetylornithine deacetylase/succinyl-diaminopimelate desuccinylase-like protein